MPRRLFFACILATTIIAGCGKPPDTTADDPVQDIIDAYNTGSGDVTTSGDVFLIETISLEELNQTVELSKAGKLMGSSNITISTQVQGRVQNIQVKEGDTIGPGRVLVTLADTISNYGIQLERAQVALQRATLTYQQSSLTLTKAITDAENNLSKAQNDFETTKQTLEQAMRQATITLADAQLTGNSVAALQLSKVEEDLQNQVDSIINSFQTQKLTLHDTLDDVLDETDQILGITDLYRGQASKRQNLLGARNSAAKNEIDLLFRQVNQIRDLNTIIQTPSMVAELHRNIDAMTLIYQQIDELLELTETVVDASLPGNDLTSTDIATFQATIDGLHTAYQGSKAGFITYTNQVDALFANTNNSGTIYDTLLDQQLAISQQTAQTTLNQAQLSYDQAVTNTKDKLFLADLNVDIATENLRVARENKTLQLALLQNAIDDAQVAVQEAARQYNKLTLTAPINGVIQEVMIDVGQETSIGTPAIKLMGNQNNEIIITVDENEVDSLYVGQAVTIMHRNREYDGSIIAVGTVADQTLSYPVTIKMEQSLGQLGGSVSVRIPLEVAQTVVPLNAIQLIGTKKATINLRIDGQLESYQVDLGTIRSNKVAILTPLPEGAAIITTPLDSYDPNKFTLQPK